MSARDIGPTYTLKAGSIFRIAYVAGLGIGVGVATLVMAAIWALKILRYFGVSA
jgi:hypothetical protein